jgi:hypothetical protein
VNKQKKNLIIILIVLILVITAINCVNAATYTFNNSTDSSSISKMISGDLPMKNGKYIKNGDVVKFKAGNYYNLKLVVKKSITIAKTKKKGKVTFIGNNKLTAIKLTNKKKKVNIKGIQIKNYKYGILGKVKSAKISKMGFYNNSKKGISIRGSKIKLIKNNFRENFVSIYILGNSNTIYSNQLNNTNSLSLTIYVKGNKNMIRNNKIQAPNSAGITINGNNNQITKNSVIKSENGITGYGNNNKISKNKINKCDYGITFGGDKNSISYNKIYNIGNSYSGGIGIYFQEGKYSKIKYNTVKQSITGLTIWGIKNIASHNKLIKNTIGIEYFKGNTINKNKFKSNKRKTKVQDKDKYELYY